jgi:predicted permease
MGSILFAVAPLYVLIAIGVMLRLIVASDAWIEVFNKFGVYVGFPAIVFSSLVKIPAGAIIETSVIACNVLFLLVAVALTYGVGRCLRLTPALRNTYVIGVFYGNVAYLGYPFVTTVIPGSEASVSIHIAIYVAFLFTVGIFVLELSKDGGSVNLPRIAKSIMTSPLLLSVVAGLLFRSTGLSLPGFIEHALELLAASAAPIVLLAIGMFIARRLTPDRHLVHAALLSSLKLVVFPLGFMLFAGLLGGQHASAVSIMEAAMPCGITIFALAEVFPMDKQVVASTIVISTVASAISLPLIATLAI